MTEILRQDTPAELDQLQQALEKIRAFNGEASELPVLSDQVITSAITGQIVGNSLIVDQNGLMSGIRDLLLTNMRSYIQKFYDIRNEFNAKFQVFQNEIKEFESIDTKISVLKTDAEKKIADEKYKLDHDMIVAEYLRTKGTYDHQRDIHLTKPNLRTVSIWFPFNINPIYLLIMLLIGMAEWFINYDTLFLFFNVPVIAIGTTFVLAIGMSLIAHLHGAFLKQWNKKFGPAIEPRDKPYGVLIFATFGLIVLISVVGWMRFQSLASIVASQSQTNIIGTHFSMNIDPTREVIISLGANFLVWMVGVFISYFAHDPDPDYVAAAVDFHKLERGYAKKKAAFDRVQDRLERHCKEQIDGLLNTKRRYEASTTLKAAITMRDQMERYEDGFRERVMTFFISQCTKVKQDISKIASQQGENLSLFRQENGQIIKISVDDLRSLPFETLDLKQFS